MAWHKIAQELGIPAGTLHAIATGKRGIPKRHAHRFAHLNQRGYRDLFAYPTKELRAMLERREVVV